MNKFSFTKKAVLVILCWVFAPFGFLYINQKRWALIYFLCFIVLGILHFLLFDEDTSLTVVGLFVITSIIHSLIITAKKPPEQLQPTRFLLTASQVSIGLAILLFCKFFVIDIYRIPSAAMAPTIKSGNKVAVWLWGYKDIKIFGLTLHEWQNKHRLNRGDIILYSQLGRPSNIYADRIVATSGDNVHIKGKTLSINTPNIVKHQEISVQQTIETIGDKQYTVQFLSPEYRDHNEISETVANQSYYLLGDNRDHSLDSRHWGSVHQQAIIGKVIYIASQNN